MNKIVELKIEETKAVVGGTRFSVPPLGQTSTGLNPPPVLPSRG